MIYRLILCVAFIGYRVNGQVIGPCSTLNTLSTNTTECQAGDKALPTSDYPSPGITYANVKELFKDSDDIKLACKQANKALYRAAAKCIANSYRHCGDNDFKTLIPTGDQYDKAIEFICDYENDAVHILKCLSDSYNDCYQNKIARENYSSLSRSSPFSDHKEYHCGLAQIEEECVRDDIDVQACLGTGTYDKYVRFRNLLRPSACGASAIIFTTSLLFVSLIASFFL